MYIYIYIYIYCLATASAADLAGFEECHVGYWIHSISQMFIYFKCRIAYLKLKETNIVEFLQISKNFMDFQGIHVSMVSIWFH